LIRLAALALLLLIVLVGGRRTPARFPVPAGIRLLFVTGSEFLVVGILLGPQLLGILDREVIEALRPFATVGLAFVGLHYGLQLEIPLLRTIPLFYSVAPAVQAAGGALAVGIPAWFWLRAWPADARETLVATLVLAAAAACSTPAPLDMLALDRKYAGSPVLRMLRHLAEMGELPALALFGLALCWRQEAPVIPGWSSFLFLQWLGLAALMGVLFGGALALLPRVGKVGTGRLLVGGLAATFFFGGMARYLHISPLFVGLVAGITVANIPGPRRRVQALVHRLEGPFMMFLLLVAGAVGTLDTPLGLGAAGVLAAAAVLVVLRLLGKGLAGILLARTTHALRNPPAGFGLGLVAQGGIAVALALDYLESGPGPFTSLVLAATMFAVLVTEMVSPWMILRVLRQEGPGRAGEGGP